MPKLFVNKGNKFLTETLINNNRFFYLFMNLIITSDTILPEGSSEIRKMWVILSLAAFICSLTLMPIDYVPFGRCGRRTVKASKFVSSVIVSRGERVF